MKILLKLFILFSTLFIKVSLNAYEPIHFENHLWNQIQKLSAEDYTKYVKTYYKVKGDYKKWRPSIESVFKRLSENSGNPGFPIEFEILADSSFNAFAFPGGQFIIHSGLLDELDRVIKENTSTNPGTPDHSRQREELIAPILAHELGHYYNKHSFQSYKERIENKNRKDEYSESREFEVDADLSGLLYLQKANFDPSKLVTVLELLNTYRQKKLNEGEKIIPYFQSHPSPHERLTKLGLDKKGIHTMASKLEYIFADIQTGNNLDQAYSELNEILQKYPENMDLQKAKVVALHKIYLESVNLEDLKYKSIIDLPSFRDNMVFDEKAKKAIAKKIPGDLKKFNKALLAYNKLLKTEQDPWLVSNYATLLALSPKKEDEKNAIDLSEKAFQTLPKLQTLNNFAICHALSPDTGDTNLALGIFRELMPLVDHSLEKIVKKSSSGSKYLSIYKKSSGLVTESEEDSETILLNLALLEGESGKELAKYYIENYDTVSKWAKYLGEKFSISTESKETEDRILVEGIGINSSIKDILKIWKEPNRKPIVEDGYEIWFYDEKGLKVSMRNGFVEQILAYKNDCPAISGIKVGSEKSFVENKLGTKNHKKSKYHIYGLRQKIGITYDENKVERVLLFKE
ncbi:MAG: M48 family metalloprotease [Leptospiraceae bacterium]|nr:M48 family metalloprotease [Leptospiraceae bacterium]